MSGGGGNAGERSLEYQQEQDAIREDKTRQAVDDIYRLFGYSNDGQLLAEMPVAAVSDYTKDLETRHGGSSGGVFGSLIRDVLNQGVDARNEEIAQHNSTAGATALDRDMEAYGNRQKWDGEFDAIYDSVLGHHRRSLDGQRDDVSDSIMAGLLRQGMGGSHLTDQYETQIDKSYKEGLGRIDSVATAAREQAESSVNNLMNNAITSVYAGNFDAANTGALTENIANSIDSASAQATAQQIDNLFGDVLSAYERRRTNLGTQLANQSYYSTAANNGTITN